MGTENKPDKATNSEAVTPRGADPILDRNHLGEAPVEPGKGPAAPDSDNGASKDPRDMGNNGNPAQSAGRPTAQEANANPAPLNEASKVTREAV